MCIPPSPSPSSFRSLGVRACVRLTAPVPPEPEPEPEPEPKGEEQLRHERAQAAQQQRRREWAIERTMRQLERRQRCVRVCWRRTFPSPALRAHLRSPRGVQGSEAARARAGGLARGLQLHAVPRPADPAAPTLP